jgi:uncharacterized protein (TIGR03000 family)
MSVLVVVGLLSIPYEAPAQAYRSFRSGSRHAVVTFPDNASASAQPAPNPAPAPDPAAAGASEQPMLYVVLPTPDAELWVEDMHTKQTGTTRAFQLPVLIAGTEYAYQMRARWVEGDHTVEQSRTVLFRAGQQVTVDFSAATPAPKRWPARRPARLRP